MEHSAIEADVRVFLGDTFPLVDAEAVDAEASLVDAGIIDSVGVLELIAFLEERYELEIDDAELVPENLDTLRRIAAFVERKSEARAAAA